MSDAAPTVTFRDSTLREGLDTPGVSFSMAQAVEIASCLADLGVPEAEIVAPSRVANDLEIVREIRRQGLAIRASGLVYGNRPECFREAESAVGVLDRIDLLMPLSPQREPTSREEKISALVKSLAHARELAIEVGAGFPHTTQVDPEFVVEMARRADAEGATRITLYDTNGSAEPFAVRQLVASVVSCVSAPVFFHGHDDLGLATANAWGAVLGGARGLDVTLNGLGDRAGNASLEQLALLLRLRGIETGIEVAGLKRASQVAERVSGVPVSKLAPVVGDSIFDHKSPTHLPIPAEFEAFDPGWVGSERRVSAPDPVSPRSDDSRGD